MDVWVAVYDSVELRDLDGGSTGDEMSGGLAA